MKENRRKGKGGLDVPRTVVAVLGLLCWCLGINVAHAERAERAEAFNWREFVRASSEQELDLILKGQIQNEKLKALCARQIELGHLPEACFAPSLWGSWSTARRAYLNELCRGAVGEILDLSVLEEISRNRQLSAECHKAIGQRIDRRKYQIQGS